MKRKIMSRYPAILLLVVLALVYLPCNVRAHRVYLDITSQEIELEAYYGDGKPIKNGDISILDENDRVLLTGKTDEQGKFRFDLKDLEGEGKITAVVEQTGHRTEIDIGSRSSTSENSSPTYLNVIAGFGYLMGLAGIASLIGAWKIKKNNKYAVMLLPTVWQYEWMEAFLRIKANEELLFSDYEKNIGKKGYSRVGGCFYSCKMAVLEKLEQIKKQAGAIVLREAYRGYVPMGVFNVRENVRNALFEKPREFDGLTQALEYLSPRFRLPMKRFVGQSTVFKDNVQCRQTTLDSFAKPRGKDLRPGMMA